MALAFRFAARSDVGLLRSHNEDSAYAGPRLLVVADGMGGAAAGEVASSVAIATVSQLDSDSPGPDLLGHLTASVQTANDHLHDMQLGDPDLRGMGTTVTALLRAGGRLGLLHIGDSRAYLLRDGELEQITHDHTFVQGLVDDGRISADEANHHPQRSVITNVLDGRGQIEPDVSIREARAGDRYLVCSDGLSGVVSEQTLAETLSHGDPDAAADALVSLALRGGGPDNITAIVADVVDVDAAPSAVPLIVGAVADGLGDREQPDSPAAKAAALGRDPVDDAVEPVEPPPGRALRRTLLALLLLAVVAGSSVAAWEWSQRQYYVGANGQQVAIFRGLSQDIGPIGTSHVYAQQDVALSDLPQYTREQVRDSIEANNLSDAQRIVLTLREQADACMAARSAAAATPVPTTTPKPTAATSPKPTTTAHPTVSRTPTATPSPSPSASPSKTVSVDDCGGTTP
jgi:protein phosphatase